jgi:hypothetical protein
MRIYVAAPHGRGLVYRLLVAAGLIPGAVHAQTDYFNTDRGRPLYVQDATAIERYAFELQLAPLTWHRSAGSPALWSIEPELAYGLFTRTQIEVGLPLYFTKGEDQNARQVIGAIHVSLLHALNVETLGWPALALNAAVSIPAGNLGPRRAYAIFGALATRTTSIGRVHLNVDARSGSAPAAGEDRNPEIEELSRWTAGIALDRAMPLRSLLVGAELVARRGMLDGADIDWRVAAGARWQVNPYWTFDAGVGRTLGDDREWSLTFGAARAFGLIHLIPLSR